VRHFADEVEHVSDPATTGVHAGGTARGDRHHRLADLGRAREQAKTVQCLSNLRQIGQAMLQYTQGFNGYLPPSSYRINTAWTPGMLSHVPPLPNMNPHPVDGGDRSTLSPTWFTMLVDGKYLTVPPVNAAGVYDIAALEGTFGQRSVLICPNSIDQLAVGGSVPSSATQLFTNPRAAIPSDGRYKGLWRAQSPNTLNTYDAGYTVNGTNAGASWMGSIGPNQFPMSRFPGDGSERTKKKVFHFSRQSSLWIVADGAYWMAGTSQVWGIGAKHAGKNANFLMADGHAETVNIDKWYPKVSVWTNSIHQPAFRDMINNVNFDTPFFRVDK
jgi:prepilin-type processing-associated H-X9-DG protein